MIGPSAVAVFAAVFYRESGALFDIYALLLSTTLVFLAFQIMSDTRYRSAQFPLERRKQKFQVEPVILASLILLLQLVTLVD